MIYVSILFVYMDSTSTLSIPIKAAHNRGHALLDGKGVHGWNHLLGSNTWRSANKLTCCGCNKGEKNTSCTWALPTVKHPKTDYIIWLIKWPGKAGTNRMVKKNALKCRDTGGFDRRNDPSNFRFGFSLSLQPDEAAKRPKNPGEWRLLTWRSLSSGMWQGSRSVSLWYW